MTQPWACAARRPMAQGPNTAASRSSGEPGGEGHAPACTRHNPQFSYVSGPVPSAPGSPGQPPQSPEVTQAALAHPAAPPASGPPFAHSTPVTARVERGGPPNCPPSRCEGRRLSTHLRSWATSRASPGVTRSTACPSRQPHDARSASRARLPGEIARRWCVTADGREAKHKARRAVLGLPEPLPHPPSTCGTPLHSSSRRDPARAKLYLQDGLACVDGHEEDPEARGRRGRRHALDGRRQVPGLVKRVEQRDHARIGRRVAETGEWALRKVGGLRRWRRRRERGGWAGREDG